MHKYDESRGNDKNDSLQIEKAFIFRRRIISFKMIMYILWCIMLVATMTYICLFQVNLPFLSYSWWPLWWDGWCWLLSWKYLQLEVYYIDKMRYQTGRTTFQIKKYFTQKSHNCLANDKNVFSIFWKAFLKDFILPFQERFSYKTLKNKKR